MAHIFGNLGMGEQAAANRRQVFDRLKQNTRVNAEESADAMQDIGAREAFARQIAVKLRPVDSQIAAKTSNRRVIAAQIAQILSENAA